MPRIPISRWIDSAALAATHALPRALGDAVEVMQLPHKKNLDGKKLIQKYSKPRKPSKANPSKRNLDAEGLLKFTRYCADDVDAMTGLFLALPPLTPFERKVWILNQRLNQRGVAIDRDLVKKVMRMTAEEAKHLDAEVRAITKGKIQSARQREAVKNWLEDKAGLIIPNMQKQTLEDALSSGLAQGAAKRIIEIRLAVSKTTTAKYKAFWMRSQADGRVRDLQMYHGASPGRDTGTGASPHNLTKPTIEDVDMALEALKSGDLAWVRCLCGSPMEAFSSCIRGCLMASPGHYWHSADFNAIESRVLFWMAHHSRGLKLYSDGADLYRLMAAVIFSIDLEAVTDAQREIGKRVILGAGFQMGPPKFKISMKQQYNLTVTLELAKKGIKAYRTEHKPVPLMWSNLERAAIAAVQNPGKAFSVNRTKWFVKGKFLYVELPSGRRIAYFGPTVRHEIKWEKKRPVLYHWSVHPKTRKWVNEGTYGGRLCENVVQGTARDFMVAGQLRTEEAGFKTLITVHDELNAEKKKRQLRRFENLMATLPPWGDGMPIKVKGWIGTRYKK